MMMATLLDQLDATLEALVSATDADLRDAAQLEERFDSQLGDLLTYYGGTTNAHWVQWFQNQLDDATSDDAERLAIECGNGLDIAVVNNELGRIVATDSYFTTGDDLLTFDNPAGEWEPVPLPADLVARFDQLTDDERMELTRRYDIAHDGDRYGLGDCWTAKATQPMAVVLRVTYDDLRAYVDDNDDDANLDTLRAWLENSYGAINA